MIAAGLEGSHLAPVTVRGRCLDLFDSNLSVRIDPTITPGAHHFLLELGRMPRSPMLLAAAGSVIRVISSRDAWTGVIEGLADIPAIIALRAERPPATVMVAGVQTDSWTYDDTNKVLWLRFPGAATPRRISITLAKAVSKAPTLNPTLGG